jgi:hypothetical protein
MNKKFWLNKDGELARVYREANGRLEYWSAHDNDWCPSAWRIADLGSIYFAPLPESQVEAEKSRTRATAIDWRN